jgi:hypothetical protein
MDTSSTTTRQRIGLGLAAVLSLGNIASLLGGPPPEGQDGPPLLVLVLGAVLGLVGLVAVVIAWRSGSRPALRVAAGVLVIEALTALPAFGADVTAALKALVAAVVLVTLLAVVLMLGPAAKAAPAVGSREVTR